jgi:hypothetical protein
MTMDNQLRFTDDTANSESIQPEEFQRQLTDAMAGGNTVRARQLLTDRVHFLRGKGNFTPAAADLPALEVKLTALGGETST